MNKLQRSMTMVPTRLQGVAARVGTHGEAVLRMLLLSGGHIHILIWAPSCWHFGQHCNSAPGTHQHSACGRTMWRRSTTQAFMRDYDQVCSHLQPKKLHRIHVLIDSVTFSVVVLSPPQEERRTPRPCLPSHFSVRKEHRPAPSCNH